VTVAVQFKLYDANGALLGTFWSNEGTLDVGLSTNLMYDWTASLGKYSVSAQAWYDSDGNGSLDAAGMKVKSFGFSVVP